MAWVGTALRSSLVGLAIIFTGAASAADIVCQLRDSGYDCEVWPQGARYSYQWHAAGSARVAEANSHAVANQRIACAGNRAGAIAVTVVAPAGYVETATLPLNACGAPAADYLAQTVNATPNQLARAH